MICIVGAGKMGKALAHGFIASGMDASEIALVDRDPERHQSLMAQFVGVRVIVSPVECDAAVIATKPADVQDAARTAAGAGAQRIVSIAAGVTLGQLRTAAPSVPVARAMPNVGVLVAQSTTGVCGSDEAVAVWTEQLMLRVGSVVVVPDENFDVVTALGGSGPAFVALVAESLIAAGVEEGLDEKTSERLVRAMLGSTAALMDATGMAPGDLRKMVSTPGGTTLAGLDAMEDNDARRVMGAAVHAAAARSRELAR